MTVSPLIILTLEKILFMNFYFSICKYLWNESRKIWYHHIIFIL